MIFVAHRVNTVKELQNIPYEYGIEVDLRDFNDKISLSHDPFIQGEDFDKFMSFFNHAFIILNIKSERIEYEVIKVLNKYDVTQYFFLDSSLPMIIKMTNNKEHNFAVRFSEYESIDSVMKLKDRVKWVWVDCFTKNPLNFEIFNMLKNSGFKICIVSPELQNREHDIFNYRRHIIYNKIIPDMVCTKSHNIHIWDEKNNK